MFSRSAAFGAVLLMLGGPLARAQSPVPTVKLSGRLHQQFFAFDHASGTAQAEPESGFFTRRARIAVRASLGDRITVVIQPEFAGGRTVSATTTCDPVEVPAGGGAVTPRCVTTARGGFRLRDAWIDLRLSPAMATSALILRAGQEKRPFGRYQLLSGNYLPSIERGAGNGLLPTATDDIFSAGGFLSHDVGASLRLETKLDSLRPIVVTVGVYNGQGESTMDANAAKSLGARATVGLTRRLEVGAAIFSHDGITSVAGSPDSSFRNTAWGVDAQWGRPGDLGLLVIADFLQGQDRTAAKRRMRGLSAVAAYHVRLGEGGWVYAVEPLARLDLADPDASVRGDRAQLVTAGIGIHFSSKAQLRVAYERQSVQRGATPAIGGVRAALTVNF